MCRFAWREKSNAQARLFPLGGGASGEAQRDPPLRSGAQDQRWALGCRRPAFLACCPRLAGGARGVVHGGHCATQARHPARAAPCTATPCLSAHTVPPLMRGARACGAGLCHRGLPGSSLGACGQLPHACALAHAPGCGAAIGDRPPLCFGSRPSRDLRVIHKAVTEQHRGYLQRIAARCVARHRSTDPSSWQHWRLSSGWIQGGLSHPQRLGASSPGLLCRPGWTTTRT